MTSSSKHNSRATVAQAVVAVANRGQSLTTVLSSVSHPEIALIQEMTYGVLRWYWQLLAPANKLLTSPMRKRDADVLALILVGFYQIEHLNIPTYAAVSETVAGCDSLGKGWAKSVVNAVLRGFIRSKSELNVETSAEVLFSHPSWLLKQLQAAWPEHWEIIAAANNTRPPMVLRVNSRYMTRESFLEELGKRDLAAHLEPLADDAIILDQPVSVDQLPGFYEGWVSVQDTAAQWAAQLLQPNPGDRVLDACAAPGGKLAHILERYRELRPVTALDVDAQRTKLINDGLRRLRLDALVMTADAMDTDAWWDGEPYQRILIDAPCSGTGVIRRHPDIKHHRRSDDIKQWRQKQALLLRSLWPIVAAGGRVVYATCSTLKSENSAQIERFVDDLDDVEVIDFSLPTGFPCSIGWQTLPGVHPVDGFYYAVLQKADSGGI